MSEILLDILKYTIPAIIVLITAYLLIKSYLDKEFKVKQMEYRFNNRKDILPMRLAAYERLALFLERISFSNLIQRVRTSDMSAKQLQLAMIQNIRMEFEHNLSQQIYVSSDLWNLVTLCKDEMIKITNLVGASLPPDSNNNVLSKAIFEFMMETEQVLPTQKALDAIKEEVKTIY